MRRVANSTQVLLICEECGGPVFIWRKSGKLKEKRHKKHMWCPTCERVHKFEERREP